MNKEHFIENYSRWSSIALICIVILASGVGIADIAFDFGLTRNIYLVVFMTASALLALLSVIWMSILSSRASGQGFEKPGKSASEPKDITFSDIELCVRTEGYIPQTCDDSVSFKISGERFDVYYQNEVLSIVKSFALSADNDRGLLLKAISQTQDDILLFRGFLFKYDNGSEGICFQIQTYVRSAAELHRYFAQYLNILIHAINRQREIYAQLIEAGNTSVAEQQTTGGREAKILS